MMTGESMAVFDDNDRPVSVGTRVHLWDDPTAVGIVTVISDFDGDVDDDTGRSITIEPRITVLFDGDDIPEEFGTGEWEFDYYDFDDEGCPRGIDARGKVEELLVVR